MNCRRVRQHLATLADVFDAATKVIRTSFPFASDLSDIARPVAIDGSLELVERGYYREAIFWIAITHSRCQMVLSAATSAELPQSLSDSYRELVADLGITSFADARRRGEEIERLLPRIWDVAERVMAANRRIENT